MEGTPPSSSLASTLTLVVGAVVVAILSLFVYNAVRVSQGVPTTNIFGPAVVADQAPTALDGKKETTIGAASVPLTQNSDYGVQFWMYIQDWDYNFGKEKLVLLRKDPTNAATTGPKITLHPTDNSLNVSVSIFPSGATAGASNPAGANDTNATGDVFTCTVENVPIQSWFSVSATVFQRNLDIYINGRLVKSCVLPGVPKPAVGDVIIGSPTTGFSGNVCNVHFYPNSLAPTDASAFYAGGTTCGYSKPASAGTDTSAASGITIFGYTFTFGLKDSKGKTISSF
jgi:hypothetical protein